MRRSPVALSLPTDRIVLAGTGVWALALAVTLLVPALHTGERSWWPWCCVAGIVLGALGWSYVRRGRRRDGDEVVTDPHRYV